MTTDQKESRLIARAPERCSLHELKVDGTTHTYWLYKAIHTEKSMITGKEFAEDWRSQKHPLILVLHGSLMTSKQMMTFSALTELAEEHDCLLCYPDMSYFWQWDVPEGFVNKDAIFLEKLIGKLITDQAIDANRVYATGFSSGADILHLLACSQKLSSMISAFAPVCSNLDRVWAEGIEHTNPISILMINGTHDKFNRWDGDKRWMSVSDSFAYWQNHNYIAASDKPTALPGAKSPSAKVPSTQAHLIQTFDRDSGSEVSLLKIDGGGHMWPSKANENWLYRMILGRKHKEHLATSVIWSFFERHPLKRKRGDVTIAPESLSAPPAVQAK